MNNDLIERLTRPIIGIENRTAQEAFDIMADRIHHSAMQEEAGKPTEAMIDLAERAIEEWLATHDGEEIDCRALARIAAMQGEAGGLREAERLLASIWFHGGFKAETHNERLLQRHMERVGLWPIESEADLFAKTDALAASPPVDQGEGALDA